MAMTGDDLKALRVKLDLTQGQMAIHMGLTRVPYIQSEGKGPHPIRTLHKMAAERLALEIAADEGEPSMLPTAVRRDVVKLAKLLK